MNSKPCSLAFEEELIVPAESATADLSMPVLIKGGANESKPSWLQTSEKEVFVTGRLHVSF